MGLMAKEGGGGEFILPPMGTHPAICAAVIDLGTQYSELYKKHQHKVLLGWELDCDPPREDGAPHMAWKRYTMSLHQKAGLRQTLEAWRGRNFTTEELLGFNLENIAGKGCLVTLTHVEREGRKYANIAGVSALPKGMSAPAASKPPVLFNLDEPNEAIFSALSDRLQEVIKSSAEWQDRQGVATGEAPPPGDDYSDGIPF